MTAINQKMEQTPKYANNEMQERGADLGYICQYASALHNFISLHGRILTPYASNKVQEAMTAIREAFLYSKQSPKDQVNASFSNTSKTHV